MRPQWALVIFGFQKEGLKGPLLLVLFWLALGIGLTKRTTKASDICMGVYLTSTLPLVSR